jgi:hypothetical protein
MHLIRVRMSRALVGAGAALALAVPMAAQANAATVRLHASTATGESLQGPSFFGTSVFLAPTNVNASNQKWLKTNVGGGYATYRSLAGTNQPMCLAASSFSSRPFAAICNSSSLSQQWTRGFVNDGRIENRSTFTALTRQANGVLEVRFLGGGQVGQNWHEHIVP